MTPPVKRDRDEEYGRGQQNVEGNSTPRAVTATGPNLWWRKSSTCIPTPSCGSTTQPTRTTNPTPNAYFWHPAFDDYPVVGVTWGQAKAFNAWRTQIMNEWKQKNNETYVQKFRLPSEAEWEFAARGGRDLGALPLGWPLCTERRRMRLANFKPMRGDYVEDANAYTAPVESYSPNDYGLYNMSGNVAEWTNTAFDETVYDFSWDLSPDYVYHAKETIQPALKRKVIRGGS